MKKNNEQIAIIGGTFDVLHEGHKDYIKLAFDFADTVYIMLTSDNYSFKSYKIKPFIKRLDALVAFLEEKCYRFYQIFKMSNHRFLCDFCLKNEITLAIVIPEYYYLMESINDLRIKNNLKPFYILVKRRGRDYNGNNLSSSQINLKG